MPYLSFKFKLNVGSTLISNATFLAPLNRHLISDLLKKKNFATVMFNISLWNFSETYYKQSLTQICNGEIFYRL